MNRIPIHLGLALTLGALAQLALLVSCADYDVPSEHELGSTEPTASAPASADVHTSPSAVPDVPFTATMTTVDTAEMREVDHIDLKVTSAARSNLTFEAKVTCHGLLTRSETRSLGLFSLQPGASQTISINPDALPLQSLDSTLQLTAEIHVARGNDSNATFVPALLPTVYFRLTDEYRKIALIGEDYLLTQLGGTLVAPESASNKANGSQAGQSRALGRVRLADGSFETAARPEKGVPLMSDGQVVAYLDGMDVSIDETGAQP